MNWYHREEKRYVEYGSSFSASRQFGVLRSLTDTVYRMNAEHLSRDVETVFLTPQEHYTFISSTLIREIASLGGDVSEFVHPLVANELKLRAPLFARHARSLAVSSFTANVAACGMRRPPTLDKHALPNI